MFEDDRFWDNIHNELYNQDFDADFDHDNEMTSVKFEQAWNQGFIDCKLGYSCKLANSDQNNDYVAGYLAGYSYCMNGGTQ